MDSKEIDETEICVMCGEKTNYSKTLPLAEWANRKIVWHVKINHR